MDLENGKRKTGNVTWINVCIHTHTHAVQHIQNTLECWLSVYEQHSTCEYERTRAAPNFVPSTEKIEDSRNGFDSHSQSHRIRIMCWAPAQFCRMHYGWIVDRRCWPFSLARLLQHQSDGQMYRTHSQKINNKLIARLLWIECEEETHFRMHSSMPCTKWEFKVEKRQKNIQQNVASH